MRRVLDAVPHAVWNEQRGGCRNGGLPAAYLGLTCARDGDNGGSDHEYQRGRTHKNALCGDERVRRVTRDNSIPACFFW